MNTILSIQLNNNVNFRTIFLPFDLYIIQVIHAVKIKPSKSCIPKENSSLFTLLIPNSVIWTSNSWSWGRDLDPDIEDIIDFGLEDDLEIRLRFGFGVDAFGDVFLDTTV